MYGLKCGAKLGKPLRSEKQEWAKEKPKLDNARRLRRLTSSILTIKITKTLSKMREENWKDLWHPSCLAKELQTASRWCLHNRRLHPRRLQKTICGCIVEAHEYEFTPQRVESSQPKNHEDTLQAKGKLR